MKRRNIAVALFALAVAGTASAQSGGMKGADTTHKATGVVTKVDKDKVTIRHGPVATIKWPSMTMAFKVKDKAVMDKLAKDRKVDFEFKQEGSDYVVTGVK